MDIGNERFEEIFIMIGDKLAPVKKAWWYMLALTLVMVIPGYYLIKFSMFTTLTDTYTPPKIIYSAVAQAPLQVTDKQIFSLGKNVYSGYIKIKNINQTWGVAAQSYMVTLKTYGGTIINTINGQTFILPSSDKLIVFSRFTSQTRPDVMEVSLSKTNFILKPDVPNNLQLERVSFQNNPSGLIVSAAIKNLTPFTINQINLPVAVFDNKNQIVAVSYTYISAVQSDETRTFQFTWPTSINGAVRAEISPEIDIFDRNVFSNQASNLPVIDQGGP